jgi:hypothetical protein
MTTAQKRMLRRIETIRQKYPTAKLSASAGGYWYFYLPTKGSIILDGRTCNALARRGLIAEDNAGQ